MITILFAGYAIAAVEAPPSLMEHFDVVYLLLVAAIGVITWFGSRSFKNISDAQKELFDRMNAVEKKHEKLEGIHEATCGSLMQRFEEVVEALRGK